MRDVTDEPAWTPDLLQSPHNAADKAGRVRRMFNAIAPRYEVVNTLFSGGRDAYWRRRAVELAQVRAWFIYDQHKWIEMCVVPLDAIVTVTEHDKVTKIKAT